MRRGKRFLEDLDQDIRDHIEQETRDNIERGMSPEEAGQAAARKFGNIALVKEDTRAVWIPIWIEQFLQDTRYGTLYVATTDTATRARIASVADDFWRLSGAHAALGRLPRPGEQDVMLLSHAFFEQQFQSDPHILGRAITVEGRQVTITGVLPNGFLFQLPPPTWLKFDSSKAIDAYRPMILSP